MPVRHGGSYVRPAPQPEPPAQTGGTAAERPVDGTEDARTETPSSRPRRGASTKD